MSAFAYYVKMTALYVGFGIFCAAVIGLLIALLAPDLFSSG